MKTNPQRKLDTLLLSGMAAESRNRTAFTREDANTGRALFWIFLCIIALGTFLSTGVSCGNRATDRTVGRIEREAR